MFGANAFGWAYPAQGYAGVLPGAAIGTLSIGTLSIGGPLSTLTVVDTGNGHGTLTLGDST